MSPELEALNPAFRDAEETYRDTVRWLYAAGHLTAKQAGPLGQARLSAGDVSPG